MRLSLATTLVVTLAADFALGSSWLSKTVYNKWHETELERWLSDHNIPYPTPADRKDLENLVKDNWNSYVVQPYSSWDTNQLQNWLSSNVHETKKRTEKNRDILVNQVQQAWHENEDTASKAYESVKDWIFDTWSESQLKAFLDRHGIPNPQPSTRDSLIARARENYQSIANKLGETTSYPGNWLYESWPESDLKAWCDERGIPVPQPSSRDKLVASVRRNSRIASNRLKAFSSSLAASAAGATQSLSAALLDAWSDSQIKEWCDKNGIKVPQGSKRNELIALARRNWARVYAPDAASSAYGAATSNAGNQYAKATDDASLYGNWVYGEAMGYVDWVKRQLGLAASSVSTSGSSVSAEASRSAKSAKSMASSVSSAASRASVSAPKAAEKEGKNRVEEAWQKATDYVKEEL